MELTDEPQGAAAGKGLVLESSQGGSSPGEVAAPDSTSPLPLGGMWKTGGHQSALTSSECVSGGGTDAVGNNSFPKEPRSENSKRMVRHPSRTSLHP